MNDINVILNGNIVKGNSGETIYDLAKRNGIEIPTLCHDPRIEPYTSCYICVVEVEGMRGMQPSCSTKITEGMKIDTQNPKVRKARKMALDLLLSNHYADCVAPCKETCPAGVDVQGYISLIEKGMYHEAVELIKETNPLPAICGRVCVRPCEVACRRNLLDEGTGVGIDYLKRFASDIDIESPNKWRPTIKPATGKKIAVIGAGPGGISAAFFLRKEGHEVDVFEGGPKPGGWLRYGIPEYRLPNDLLQKEFDNIAEMGVNIHYNQRLGDNLKFADMKAKYDATILAIGSQKGTGIGCEGDDAGNVLSGVDFLRDMEMTGERYDFRGKRIAVVGGGNTAMDCCRSSIRCGSTDVVVIYRRTEAEMPANPIEIHESKLEGVKYLFLTNPTKVNKDENGKLKSVTCQRMELGEPDASGRRRPVPVEGSEYEIELDYVLAAIGQKTDTAFLQDINQHYTDGQEVKANRWGDLDADKNTLQMGIPSFFAAGDGVTGPATLIQAVGQAKIAARSCHQYLMGMPIEVPEKEFISRRDHFKEQKKDDYVGYFENQHRQEMATLDPSDRLNFNEVELGYEGFQAEEEVKRCLECGCTEYYTCDLKRYGTEYKADQKRVPGEYKEYKVDFRHPYIEIDNNKCILCSRCIRICREVVGANALGLVNRGYDTFVAPSMGNSLQETSCESCGLCISTCPTGAITENVPFKPGPVKLSSAPTICNYCSVGCEISYEHKNGFVMRVTGRNGQVNELGNLCRYAKFGYQYINRADRIRKPMLKVNGKFEEISFEKAYEIITDKMKQAGSKNAFFAGARLTNEEMYLIQKLARVGVKSPNVGSFHYLGQNYAFNSAKNVPFDQIGGASKIFMIGTEINKDNAVAGFMIQDAAFHKNIPVELITTLDHSSMEYKLNDVRRIKSYYHFIKAVNYYLVANDFHNQLYINDNTIGYEEYKSSLMKEDFSKLIADSGVKFMDEVIEFAKAFNNEMNAIIVYSEKELGTASCRELHNLAMLTGKLGKTSNGLISLKEKNNSHGLYDMGAHSSYLPGMQCITHDEARSRSAEVWGIQPETLVKTDLLQGLNQGDFAGLFIFGEDPLGCATDKSIVQSWLNKASFKLVQDYFLTETTLEADLVMPASIPAETGGSFSNTQHVIQPFDAVLPVKEGQDSVQQLISLLKGFGSNGLNTTEEVLSEAFRIFSPELKNDKDRFVYTTADDYNRLFDYGCDSLTKLFQETLAV
jgi:formate dehydrogenase major subunit